MPTSEQLTKFEKFWRTLWNYLYTLFVYLGYEDAKDYIDEDFEPVVGSKD